MLDRVRIFDNFLPQHIFDRLVEECFEGTQLSFKRHRSRKGRPNSQNFFSCDLTKVEEFSFLFHMVQQKVPEVSGYNRCYINCHPALINGSFHNDDCDLTAILFIGKEYDAEWGGWTQLHNGDFTPEGEETIFLTPHPNRLVVFPGEILHKGHAFNHQNCPWRFNLVWKMLK